jgi:hypothetical protein
MLDNGEISEYRNYIGTYIECDNTLDSRTENMRIGGRTLVNLVKYRLNNQKVGNPSLSATLCTNEMFKINTTYTIIYTINSIESGTGKTTLNFSGGMSAPDIILNSSNLVGTHKQTFTLSTMPSVTHKNVSLYHIDRSTVKFFSDVLIVEGEIDFIPSYFEGIKSFGEAEGNKISILSHGKNLFDLDGIGKNFNYKEIKDGFEIYNTADFPYPYANIKKRMFLKKGTYTFSYSGEGTGFVNIAVRSTVDDTSYSGDVKPNIPKTFTLDTDKEVFVTFYLQGNITTGVYKNKYTHIQIVEGSQNLSYEPYQEDKRDILLTQPLREGDYIYERNKQIKVCRNFKEYNITGNESWNQYTDKSDFSCIGFYLDINTKDDAKLDGKFICNSFKVSDEDVFPGSITVDDELIFIKGRSGPQSPSYIKISILKSKLSTQDIDGFKK